MGGRALKNVVTRRCDREEFDVISLELINILKLRFNKVGVPMFYKNKPDFGDIEFSDFIDVDFGEEEMPTKYSPEKPGE